MPTSVISIDVISSAKKFAQRKTLYSEFINEAARLLILIAGFPNEESEWIGDHLRVAQSDSTQLLRGSH
jgi:hypothetical protein